MELNINANHEDQDRTSRVLVVEVVLVVVVMEEECFIQALVFLPDDVTAGHPVK